MKKLLGFSLVLAALALAGPVVAQQGPTSTNVQQALTSSAVIKTQGGALYGFDWFNPNAGTAYVFIYDSATAPTIGSTTGLIYEKGIPAGAGSNFSFSVGIKSVNGLYIAVSSSPNSSSAPGTGLVLTTFYQ